MIFSIYKIITNFLYLPFLIYLILRLFKKKEDLKSLLEKNGFYSNKKPGGKLIWINATSIGESLSTLPLIKKILLEFPNSKVLLTTSTQSANKVMTNRRITNLVLQYAPLDFDFIIKKFLKHWKPDICILIESEIWPNLICKVRQRKIPLILLNGRMSDKSFKRWNFFRIVSKKLFKAFDLCLVQSDSAIKKYKQLGCNNAQFCGNLKFFAKQLPVERKNLKEFNKQTNKRTILLLASSHFNEEEIFVDTYKKLKKKITNLLLVIVPRHIDRSKQIIKMFRRKKIEYKLRSNQEIITTKTDCYLADTFDELGLFYKTSNCVIIGGSFINHGGQNLIEAANFNCPIVTGPFMNNFIEIEKIFLKKKSIIKLKNSNEAYLKILKIFQNKKYTKELKNRLHHLCLSEKRKKNVVWATLKSYLRKI